HSSWSRVADTDFIENQCLKRCDSRRQGTSIQASPTYLRGQGRRQLERDRSTTRRVGESTDRCQQHFRKEADPPWPKVDHSGVGSQEQEVAFNAMACVPEARRAGRPQTPKRHQPTSCRSICRTWTA